LLDSLLQETFSTSHPGMYLPASPWPLQSGSLYSSRSSSSTDSWESSSSQGGSPPPRESAWGQGLRLQGRSSHGLLWDKHYEDILGGDVDAWHGMDVELQGGEHDLLDRLVKEHQDENLSRIRLHNKQYEETIKQQQMLSSLEVENLLKLLQIQQTSPPAPQDRASSRFQSTMNTTRINDKKFNYSTLVPPPNSFFMNQNQTRKQDRSTYYSGAMQGVSNCFSPTSFVAPRPLQPPATSASANLANQQGKNQVGSNSPSPGSNVAVHLRVQEARWQFQALETERKKTEAAIAKENPGMRISSSNTILIPRLPLNPTKLDKLLVDSLREQARVLTLLHRIETTSTTSRSSEFANLLAMWKEKILVVMAIRRKERMSNMEMGAQLGESLASMSLASRKARTVLWGLMMKKVNN